MSSRKNFVVVGDNEESKQEVIDINEVVFSHEAMEVRSLIEGYEKKNILVNVQHQRNFVWNEVQQSYFIVTVLFDIIPVPPFQFYRANKSDMVLKVTDAQQRLVTLHRFKAGFLRLELRGFPIKHITIDGKDYDIIRLLQGKCFDDLPQKFKVIFNRRSLRVDIANNCPDSYSELYYVLYNSGVKALKPHEVRLASMGTTVRGQFSQMIKYDIFKYTKLSYMMKYYKAEYDITAHIFMLLYYNQPCDLTSYKVDNFINQFRLSGIPKAYEAQMHLLFKYLSDVVEYIFDGSIPNSELFVTRSGETRKINFLSKANLVTTAFVASHAIDSGVSPETFAEFMVHFYTNLPHDYKARLRSNLNGLKSNRDRINAMNEMYQEFICSRSGEVNNNVI